MQEALQAAVARLNSGANGSGESKFSMFQAFAPLLPLLPKLLNTGASEEMLERLDTLQKNDLWALRDQVQILRKQCERMLKARVHEIQRQQVAAAGAVLDLAQQMARITFVEDHGLGDDDEEDGAQASSGNTYRSDSRLKNGSGGRQRET
jgi:uncharacterized protein (DUF58 family)